MLTFAELNLRDNPFGVAPAGKLVWADRSELKLRLEKHLKFSLISRPSSISAICWGKWGAGKPHSMKYFSQEDVIKKLSREASLPEPPLFISVIFPIRDVIDTFYFDIIDAVWSRGLKDVIKRMMSDTSLESVKERKAVFSKLLPNERLVDVFSTGDLEFIIQYLNMNATQAKMRARKISRGIQTVSDKLETISGIFNMLCKTQYSKIIFWIDDAERVELLSARDLADAQTFLRDLLDYVPENLILIMNITPKVGRKIDDVLYYFGDAIQSRLGAVIEAGDLEERDFLSYVKDLLSEYREKSTTNEYQPFNEEAIRYVFKIFKERNIDLVPRNINLKFSNILERALFEEKRSIDKAFIEEIKDEVFPPPSYRTE